MSARTELRARFDAAASARGFRLSPEQRAVADELAALETRRHLRGIYLHGPVGRGKSFLINTFFDAAPVRGKLRVHFHEFFDRLHRLTAEHLRARRPRPTTRAVDDLLAGCRLVCFDEFHVHDPGDAALITHLLRALLERPVTLVTTSNYRPADLLPHPVHHHLFEPAIDLLETRLQVLELGGDRDYRAAGGTGERFAAGSWGPIDLPSPTASERTALPVGERTVTAAAVRGALVWFDFAELCGRATSTTDYLALAARFSTWVLSGVPHLSTCDEQARRRFADLVDVLCDRDVTLHVATSRTVPETLCDLRDLSRTASRLTLLRTPGSAP